MSDYRHYRFTPERRRIETASLIPPLKWLEDESLSGVGYPPKFAAGKMFVSFVDGRLEAFETQNRELVWSFRLPNGYRDGVPNDGDMLISGDILITRLGGEMFILDNASGALRDRQSVPEFDLGSAVLLGSKVFGIYVDEEDEKEPLYCFAYDIQQRAVLWKQAVQRFPESLAASAAYIFLSNRRGHFTCLSMESGQQVWSFSVLEMGAYVDLERTNRKGDVTGIPCLWEDLVIVPVEGYHVLALDQASGALRWVQTVEFEDPRSLVCGPDGVLILLDAGVCVSIEAATGRMLSKMDIQSVLQPYGGPLLTEMDVAGDFLYFSTIHQGVLVALDRTKGEIPWTFQCAAAVPIRHAPLVIDRRLYLVDEEHNL